MRFRYKEFLRDNRLTQEEVAKVLGVSQSWISMSKTSGQIDKYRLELLKKHYGEEKVAEYEIIENSVQTNFGRVKFVPLLPISVQGGTLNDFVAQITERDCEMILSPSHDAELAIRVNGQSMYPEYPDGSLVFVKRINEKAFIEWGRVYVLDTVNGSVLKKIEQTEDPGTLRCVSINPAYGPFEVKGEHIYGIYKVLLCLSVK